MTAAMPARRSGLQRVPAPAVDGLLLDALLLEQQTLRTPVAIFSDDYDARSPARRFSHLIPLSKPEAGEQYAFEVNLDACTGCKACVAACHSLNGLDDGESWRDVGALVGTTKQPYLQTITSACHHCTDPACSNGCPVLAYEKDEATGIVRHLDDQCIGCSYCILKCPYDVPKFNTRRGIVRKCDMCHGRLAKGEAPACVQACPNEAIRIRVVSVESEGDDVVFGTHRPTTATTSQQMLPGVFPSDYTQPMTRYVSARPLPLTVQPADASRLTLDHEHEPLAWMLVLTQMSAGAFAACAVALWCGGIDMKQAGLTCAAALGCGLTGIALSVLHLGQPLKAWRAFLGWRRSWLSREIIVFGTLPAGGAAVLLCWWSGNGAWLRGSVTVTAVAALLAVLCSVMVYVDTRRPFWSAANVAGKFFGTAIILGSSLCAAIWEWSGSRGVAWAFGSAWVGQWMLALWEAPRFHHTIDDESCAWHRSARILQARLRSELDRRLLLLLASGLVIPALIAAGASRSWMLGVMLVAGFCSQLIERRYFFTASAGSKMPGP